MERDFTQKELARRCEDIAAEVTRLAEENDYEKFAAWFDDALDVKFTIDMRMELCGVRVAVGLGGPNIYIDTNECSVVGYWGCAEAEYPIDTEVCDQIDEYYRDVFDSIR